jgi:transposase
MLNGIRRFFLLFVNSFLTRESPILRSEEPVQTEPLEVLVNLDVGDSEPDSPGRKLTIHHDGDPWSNGIKATISAISRRKTVQARLVARAKIVVGVVFEGRSIAEMARELGTTRATIRFWARRFRENGTIEALDDHHRTGRPARLGTREQAVVLGLACQRPEDLGRIEGRMTQPIIVEEATKQGLKLSRSSVQRIMALAEVKPYRERYYLFTVKDRPEYIARRDAICDAYTREYPKDEVLICIDEKTGIQALGLPKKLPHGGRRPAAPGLPARIDQHYVRHGARTLVIAVLPNTGRLAHSAVFPSRGFKSTEAIQFLRDIAVTLPKTRVIHVIWDNGPTHTSKVMKSFLASDEGQRFHVLYTPPHASWVSPGKPGWSCKM